MDGTFDVVDLTTDDVERMSELVHQFSSPLDGTDASVVAVAERLGVREIATFDRRHFPAITPTVRRPLHTIGEQSANSPQKSRCDLRPPTTPNITVNAFSAGQAVFFGID